MAGNRGRMNVPAKRATAGLAAREHDLTWQREGRLNVPTNRARPGGARRARPGISANRIARRELCPTEAESMVYARSWLQHLNVPTKWHRVRMLWRAVQ